MQALIQITTDKQGASVVSARELHGFLEVRSKFADWFKNRVAKYGLVEKQDFVAVSKSLENGGRELDYGLTLDCAKELAMVQSNERGKQARQYFIDCEKQQRQVVTQPTAALPSTNEQVLIELAQQNAAILQQNQIQIAQLRADINAIMQGQPKNARRTTSRPPFPDAGQPSSSPLFGDEGDRRLAPYGDAVSLRRQITVLIEDYSNRWGCMTAETYRYLYGRMQTVYGVNVYQLHKQPGQSYLDAIAAYGQLDRFYALLRAELAFDER